MLDCDILDEKKRSTDKSNPSLDIRQKSVTVKGGTIVEPENPLTENLIKMKRKRGLSEVEKEIK